MMFMKKRKKKVADTVGRKLITVVNPLAVISEQFKTIRTNINFSTPDKDLKTMVITSSVPSEGKSTVSSNVAVVFSQEGKRVLLVDADMRKPTVHHTFNLPNTSGLANVLTRQATIDEVIQDSCIEGLKIMTCGPIPPNPAELLASQMMTTVMNDLVSRFDVIIFDAPPILSVTDAQILGNKCDGAIIVANTGVVEKAAVLKSKELLMASQAKILGVVLNNYKLERDHYYYKYYASVE